MKNVRKDVRLKLLEGYVTRLATNPQQGGYSYSTRRADHSIRCVDGVLYYNSIGYDGTYYHTAEKLR